METETIITNERDEDRAIERVPADRPDRADVYERRPVPDIMGRDILAFEPAPGDPF